MYVAMFVIAMVAAIMLHEAGHFGTARLFGMRAERFFLGFGPTLWSTQRGETEYGVKAIPAGGFVKITGMNKFEDVGDDVDMSRVFYTKPAWQRAIVLAAGSVTHFVIAGVLLFVALAFFTVPALRDGQPVISSEVGDVVPDSPAAAAGLEAGDRILAVDGVPTRDFEELVETVSPLVGEQVALEIERDGRSEVVPVHIAEHPERDGAGYLGIYPGSYLQEERSVSEALAAVVASENSLPAWTWRSLQGIAQVFTPSSISAWLQQADSGAERTAEGPISLVGAGQAVSALGQAGEFSAVLLLLAQLNIVIGALNLLPLPPFDGGHLAVLGVEAAVNTVRARRGQARDWAMDPATLMPLTLTVLLFFTLFAITAFYIDIVNPVSSLLE